jgi:hypothetical protein
MKNKDLAGSGQVLFPFPGTVRIACPVAFLRGGRER